MKQKSDETLDQWVRQSLRQLPNTPPPGSSFDPERVWAQLRPELQAAPARRRVGWAWWTVAACLGGLVLGWFWLHQSSDDRNEVVAHRSDRSVNAPIITHHKPNSADKIAAPKSVVSEDRRTGLASRTQSHRKETPKEKSTLRMPEPIEAVPQTSDLQVVAEVPPVVEKRPELPKPNVATTTAKRWFRVVHENELRAEEEARPKLYRTGHFVRLGTGRDEKPVPDEDRPTLLMPLTNKPNH